MADIVLEAKAWTLWPDTRLCKGRGNARHTRSRSSTGGGQDTCEKVDLVIGKAINITVAVTLPEEKTETLSDTMVDVKGQPLLDTLTTGKAEDKPHNTKRM